MSVYVDVTIRCDQANCPEQLIYTAKNEGGLNVSRALAWAGHAGWAASVKTAKCPKHRRPARTHEFTPGHAPNMCYRKVGNGHCYRHKEHPIHG